MREMAPGSRREPRVSLVFYFREGAKIVVPGPEPRVVGRTWPADVVVDDPSVSRTHARFFVAPDAASSSRTWARPTVRGSTACPSRAVETKQIVRVDGDRDLAVDVRVIAATHRDLEKMCAENTCRWDLFYRLHGVTVALPPLRERIDEVRPLADGFMREANRDNARYVRAIDDAAMSALLHWQWPGNIRELKNVVERAVVIARSDVVTLDDLPERLRAGGGAGAAAPAPTSDAASAPVFPSGAPAGAPDLRAVDPALDDKERLRLEMQRYETDLIVAALAQANGNVTAAAQALKIPVRTLTHKMQALGIRKRSDPA